MITEDGPTTAFNKQCNSLLELVPVTGNIAGTKDLFHTSLLENRQGFLHRGGSCMHITDQTD